VATQDVGTASLVPPYGVEPAAGPPAWFRAAVIDGLQYLLALRLPGCPAADAIEATGRAWLRACWGMAGWDEAADTWRMRAAFDSLARNRDTWPAPRHWREAMPGRRALAALPAPEMTAEQRAANQARVRGMLRAALGAPADGGTAALVPPEGGTAALVPPYAGPDAPVNTGVPSAHD
jgi:hypothetical protein